jgi:hypothetical protein
MPSPIGALRVVHPDLAALGGGGRTSDLRLPELETAHHHSRESLGLGYGAGEDFLTLLEERLDPLGELLLVGGCHEVTVTAAEARC